MDVFRRKIEYLEMPSRRPSQQVELITDAEERFTLSEERKKALNEVIMAVGEVVDEKKLIAELNTYLDVYHVSIEAAKRGLLRKYGKK